MSTATTSTATMSTKTGRRRVWGVVASVVVAAGAVLVAPPAASAGTPQQCRVKNTTQDTWYATPTGAALTRALELARPGDRLNVFGRCRGSFAIDKDVTLYGTTNRRDPTVLDGAGATGRPVVGVPEWATVALHRLTITGGDVTTVVGGGILNGGNLTLHRSAVVGNRSAMEGGGIFNYGTLTLNHTRVSRNRAGVGGGIFNEGVATLNHSRVTYNTADFDGGIGTVNTLVLHHTVVAHNTPNDCSSC